MENWRSYKFFDGWIMKKIEHTYNFNFKNKYRQNQPVSECKYTYCCDSLDNTLSLCEETSFYSSETPSMRKDRRKLRRKKLVKKVRRNEDRYRRYSSSESEEEYRRRRKNYQRIFIHQKIIYDEYITKKDRKFYPTRLKMLSQERWSEELPKKKDDMKNDAHEKEEKEEKCEGKGKREESKVEKDEKEVEREAKGESSRPYPPPPLAQPPLPPPPMPPPLPPPPPPPLPPPQTVRLVAVNSGGYLPVQQVTTTATPPAARPYNEQQPQQPQQQQQLPYGTIAGIAYEIPVDITYIIGCNAMFRQF